MNLIQESLPEIIGSLVVTGLVVTGGWLARRRAAQRRPDTAVRRYTVLNQADPSGNPIVLSTTYPAGSVVTLDLGTGGTERIRLTDAPLSDGTYAAEPMDRY
ncbi:hypothetical protein [Streptomyces chartreusis]|uniref:hypothetical protein n=1 Tax=Streptomyces chartreusis TaxID=1969 RepID=UPI00340F48F2